MSLKKCQKCQFLLDEKDEFCGNCGAKVAQLNSTQYAQTAALDSNSQSEADVGFFINFFWTHDYSVSRAMWLYRKTESAFNLILILALIYLSFIAIRTLYIAGQVAASMFFEQLWIDIKYSVIFYLWLLVGKLMLMTMGSIIYMAEMAEQNNKK